MAEKNIIAKIDEQITGKQMTRGINLRVIEDTRIKTKDTCQLPQVQ